MNLLTIEHLTKSYTERLLFNDTAFSINEGEKVGLIGINGTGKSTLLRIAAGLEEPDGGTVVKGRSLYIRYLPQIPEFTPGDTILDSIVRDNKNEPHFSSVEELKASAKTMLNRLEIEDFDAKVETLSGGQRKRVALASVLLSTADLLILDEPTNHLDSQMADWLEGYLKAFKGALLMITHDRYFLDSVTNRIVELDKGKLYSYQGGYEKYLELKAERLSMAEAAERKRQSILRTEIAWMQRGARARSTKQKAHIQRYEQLRDQEGPEYDRNVQLESIGSRLGRTTVELKDICKSYGDKVLMKDFTYIFLKNDRVGIIGQNGSGKSTLMKIIAGWVQPDSGTVEIGQTVKLGYFSQENEAMDESLKVIDYIRNAAEYVKTKDGSISASQMLERFLFPSSMQYTTIGKLSGGEKRRLYLLRILMEAPNVLILDEPTNDLDIQTLILLEDYLDTFPGIVITVSHDRYFLDRVVNRIVEVDHGKLYNYPGNYSEFVRLKAERQNMELATERKRKSLLRTELEWLHRGARARSTKQKAHIDRIHAMQEMKDIQEEKRVMLDSVASRMGNKTIELSGICKSYGEKKLIEDFSYIFLKKDRIGIIGHNGCGKSTLLKIINGIIKPDVGTIEIGQTIKIGYFSQENEYMDESKRVIDYVKEAGEYIATSDGKITASQMLERFLFDGAMQWSRIDKLSGGEKRRLYLLRVLMEAPNVLILDEPTNDLDIQTLTILEDYLDHFDGIILIVSHDRYFLDRTVSRIFAFNGGGKIRQSEGGYSDYLIRVELEKPEDGQTIAEKMSGAVSAQAGESDSKKTWKQREKKLKFSYKEQREYETIDEDIAKLEEKIEKLDQEIVKNATNSVKLSELMKEKEETETALEEKMDRWVYLNDLAEQIENQ